MNDATYNGWTNYETWVVNLWMSNDGGSQYYYADLAELALSKTDRDDDLADRIEDATDQLEHQLKDQFEESCPIQEASVWSDLIRAALGAVNWREIAEQCVQAAAEDLEESEAAQ